MKNKEILQKLREKGYKITPQRRAVLETLGGSSTYLTPAELFELARVQKPDIGIVTVYRTLDVLGHLNLVCKLNLPDGSTGFLLRRPYTHHHHLVCASCGLVVDFSECGINELEHTVADTTGFTINSHSLELNGICPECKRRIQAQ